MAGEDSIWNRKKDLVYLVFFMTHIPVMLAFDLTSYYPVAVKPGWMTDVRTWYIATFGDRFFYNAPAWFSTFTLLELVYHLPFSFWAIPALIRNDPRIPLALLVFALETSITTITCLAEMLSWDELTPLQRGVQGLGGMYGAYLAVGVFMAVDCYARLDRILSKQKGITPITKKKL
ncbi:uncharacterized protein CC84DRAFT_1167755 [Paraphaeosphaeria sporulosa]|uniref:Efficient mitochondria targeting-associated protein 19 n=1 Tax=Paraphaeosphaeria sporulosa TaxID=1460663 RepID=A0A177C4F0_9PLEO|nr:uncharacterized protein CC84DRAFT_1167755 [Paraphaeosphaeria sporulosa]OAG01550.1 hypothetical protein CC84DRAFT_1167755 [Paraphaeosphaeria sporulosa]